MPKNKKDEDSNSSDSGPEDCNPPPKKAKTDGGKSGPAPKKNEEGHAYWEIGSSKRLTVRTYKNTTYIDIREFYEKDGKKLPGKKGISLKSSEWEIVKNLSDMVAQAVEDM